VFFNFIKFSVLVTLKMNVEMMMEIIKMKDELIKGIGDKIQLMERANDETHNAMKEVIKAKDETRNAMEEIIKSHERTIERLNKQIIEMKISTKFKPEPGKFSKSKNFLLSSQVFLILKNNFFE
jgi:F0F1-type ATP synthase membrane subunit b/b'